MIISFSGVDGGGKSTQIELLSRRLGESGTRARTVWARGGYTPGFELIKRAMRKLMGSSLPETGKGNTRSELLATSWVTRLWLIVAILDLTLLYSVVVRFHSMVGRLVLCDRYLWDTELDFMLNFPQVDVQSMWAWKFLSFSAPVPDISFLFLVPVDTSLERSKMKGEPFPDEPEVLIERLKFYSESVRFRDQHFHHVDGNDPIDVVHEEMYAEVAERVPVCG